jgi:hypothetical protein
VDRQCPDYSGHREPCSRDRRDRAAAVGEATPRAVPTIGHGSTSRATARTVSMPVVLLPLQPAADELLPF